jgi:hydrogenase expression/formation protein HypC
MCLAVPGKVIDIEGEDDLLRSGTVKFGGILKKISLAYTPEVQVGDYVLVHAGVAINKIDEKEAQEVFDLLRRIEEESEDGAGS